MRNKQVDVRLRLTRWLAIAIALSAIMTGALRVSPQSASSPILVVVNGAAANRFGGYLAEILKAEGLNSYAVAELSSVTATSLNSAQVVVLADTPLTAAQALLFSKYVAGGGRLIAMRPDAQLLPVLGLSATGSSTSEGYFAINPGTSFADGFTTTTLPFHGQAQNYTPTAGAQVLATLYSNASTATGFPAVV